MKRVCRKCGAQWDTGETCPACHTEVFPFAAVVCHGAATVTFGPDELNEVCNRLERKGWHYMVFWASPHRPESTSDTDNDKDAA